MLCVKLAGTTPYALLREGEIRLSLCCNAMREVGRDDTVRSAERGRDQAITRASHQDGSYQLLPCPWSGRIVM